MIVTFKEYKYRELSSEKIKELCRRNEVKLSEGVSDAVHRILDKVEKEGDKALLAMADEFDGVKLTKLFADKSDIEKASALLDRQEKTAIDIAYSNIKKFHEAQLLHKEREIETLEGVVCWRETRAIEKVGLYVPGGSAVLPSTFLMLGIPAKIAGCKEIIVCSPPQKDGNINRYLAYCAYLLGIERIYLAGGAQAVAAMALGTDTIPKVFKIFGPGNKYVTYAKQYVQATTNTAIDMPAGPSEVLIIADENAQAEYVAADILAQAEHGRDSQSVLVTNSEELYKQVCLEIKKQTETLSRKEIAINAIFNSYAVIVDTLEQAMSFSNEYAPEHLILSVSDWEKMVPNIINAGSVFLGYWTPESAGDYASGTNHTLPTSAFAKSYSGVSVDSFVKKITFQHITEKGVENLAPTVEKLADIEGLDAHKMAMKYRRLGLNNKA